MKKIKKRSIVFLCLFGLLIAALFAGNIVCVLNAGAITQHLSGSGIKVDSDKAQATLSKGDELVGKIADEGIVLLKNNGVLPLKKGAGKYKINLFGVGSTADGFTYSGIGSGASTIVAEDIIEDGNVKFKRNRVSLREGLEASGFEVNADLLASYANGNTTTALMDAAKTFSDTAIVTISRHTGENVSTQELLDPTKDSIILTNAERSMVDYVAANFDKVIILFNSTNTMEMGFLDAEGIDAALNVGACGQSGTKSIGRILTGEVNPSGKTTFTAPYDTTKDPTYVNAIRTAGGNNQIFYAEDIYMGYKWYETAYADKVKIKNNGSDYLDFSTEENYRKIVQYPFGYGLSYSDFDWALKGVTWEVNKGEAVAMPSDGVITHRKTRINVTVEVHNNGPYAGKDVVQIYSQAPYYDGEIEKPHVSLIGYEKTELIPSGDSDEVTVSFDVYDMASYDCYDKNNNGVTGWELDPGDYRIRVMDSAHDASDIDDIVVSVPDFGDENARKGYVYRFDPTSNGYVKNRFTGEDAEGGMPIDANMNETDESKKHVKYFSRADFNGTFPRVKPTNHAASVLANANAYYYQGYDEAEKNNSLALPEHSRTEGEMLYLYTLEGGGKATVKDLQRTGAKIVANEELIMQLGADYKHEKWATLISQLTPDEIRDIVAAAGFGTIEAESIGKPKLTDFDGPSGFNRKMASLLESSSFAWTAFPAESVLACSWNKRLAYEMGFNMGDEAPVMGGITGLYAPTVNLQRTPYNTRNYEAYSEDGVLSGYMGAAMINGATDNGLTCYLKHLALSEPGYNPNYLNTWLTEQNFRENYLKAFEIAVKQGGANGVMSAFNRIGAVDACNSYALLTQVLRGEWGFRGAVVTDYNMGDVNNQVRSGNDLHLLPPGNSKQNWLDKYSSADMTAGQLAVKNTLYSYCNTYYRAKTYNPDAKIGVTEQDDVFAWWVPVLVTCDVLVAGCAAWYVIALFKPQSKKKEPQAA